MVPFCERVICNEDRNIHSPFRPAQVAEHGVPARRTRLPPLSLRVLCTPGN